mmetsp:Transcript_4917/g.12707  ORF Transcript_4917/g.12707 Transcript_4917/m.12707 type:complete len:229 (+) Transcript_4917:526-1212(+)
MIARRQSSELLLQAGHHRRELRHALAVGGGARSRHCRGSSQDFRAAALQERRRRRSLRSSSPQVHLLWDWQRCVAQNLCKHHLAVLMLSVVRNSNGVVENDADVLGRLGDEISDGGISVPGVRFMNKHHRLAQCQCGADFQLHKVACQDAAGEEHKEGLASGHAFLHACLRGGVDLVVPHLDLWVHFHERLPERHALVAAIELVVRQKEMPFAAVFKGRQLIIVWPVT